MNIGTNAQSQSGRVTIIGYHHVNKCVCGSLTKSFSSITEKFGLTGTGLANTSRKLSRPTRICVTGKLSQNCKLTTGQSPGKSCLDANWSFSKKWIFMKPDFKTAFETITKPPTLVSDVSFVVDPFSGCYSDFLFLPGMLCFFLPRMLFRGFLSSQNVFTRQFSFFSGCYSYFLSFLSGCYSYFLSFLSGCYSEAAATFRKCPSQPAGNCVTVNDFEFLFWFLCPGFY